MANQIQTKAHLVLSSGGVKCISYAGAIGELERNGVELASVSACSGGSLAGALYGAGLSAEELEKETLDLDFRDLFGGRNYFWRWLFSSSFFETQNFAGGGGFSANDGRRD